VIVTVAMGVESASFVAVDATNVGPLLFVKVESGGVAACGISKNGSKSSICMDSCRGRYGYSCCSARDACFDDLIRRSS